MIGVRNVRRVALFSALFVLFGLAGGCRDAQVASAWREHEIVIDGVRTDWQVIDVYNFDDEQVLLGIVNDSESLFLLLVTSNRNLGMQALTAGFTASFRGSAEGSEGAKGLSVRYALQSPAGPGPDGQAPADRGTAREGPGERPERASRGPMGGPPDERGIQRLLEAPPGKITVVGPAGDDTLYIDPDGAARLGIEERIGYKGGYFVLEMKVPLRNDTAHPYSVGLASTSSVEAARDEMVEVRLQIPKRKGGTMTNIGPRAGGGGRSYSQDDGDEDPDGSDFPGRGGPGGREGGPGGRRPPSATAIMANGLDLVLNVVLGTAPGDPADRP